MMADERGPQVVALRFASVPLLGCGGAVMLACCAAFLYKGVMPASSFLSETRRAPEIGEALGNVTLLGTSPIALVLAGFFAWIAFDLWWRASDPVAFVAGPRGVGVHPSIWRGMLRWHEIEAVTIAPHRSRGITTQCLTIRLREPHGWRRRQSISVRPVDGDEAAHRRVLAFVGRHLSAPSGAVPQ